MYIDICFMYSRVMGTVMHLYFSPLFLTGKKYKGIRLKS